MNMFSTGNPEEDELLRLLRQGLITPEQLTVMAQASAPTFESEQIQSPAPTLQSEQVAPPTLRSEQVAPSMEERKRRMIDAGVGGLLRETATGMSNDQLLERMMMDQLEIGEKARDVPQDVSRDIQQGARDDYGSLPITSFQEDPATSLLREARKRNAGGVGAPSDAVRVDSPNNLQIGEKETQPQLLARVSGTREPIDFTTIAPNEQELPIESSETEPTVRDLVAGMDTTQRRSTDPRIQLSTERAEEGEISPVSEGVEVGLLSRIGKAITDNPELAASGAQLLGGLISNAAQNRAQRKADRTTDQRVARATLISALTGGRARPTVERAQADTGGFMSLDTLGKVFQGGGAAVKGELARQVEEAERERKAKLEERGMKASELGVKSLDDYRKATLAFNEKKFDKETQLAAEQNVVNYLKAAKDLNESERIPIKEIGELSSELASLKRLDNLEDFIIDADFSFLEMGPLRLEEPSQFIFGSDARVAESAIQGLIAEVAKTIPGVLTEGDQKRLETRLLSLNDTESTALDVAQAFREELLVKFEERLGALRESGGFDTTYFDDRLMEYRQGRGAQGFESMLTKDEIVLGG